MTSGSLDGELSAIERSVAAAVGSEELAVVRLRSGLSLFIVPKAVDNAERANLKAHLWGQIFDTAYAKGSPPPDPTFNSTTFDSSYSKAAMPEDDLRPVIEGVAARVLDLSPKTVLELGCGTGMLLFRIAPHCQRYVGLDLSANALDHAQRHLGELRDRVELMQGSATSLDGFADRSIDLVLINSTVQYFPGVEYLLNVLRGAERVVSQGGHIVLGDLRSKSVAELLYGALAVHHADDSASAESLRTLSGKSATAERELLLEPCFLHTLSVHLPRLSGAFHALHASQRVNELTQFRYNALLCFDGPLEPVVSQWLDWPGTADSLERVRAWIAESREERVGVRGVPNERVRRAVAARRWLASAQGAECLGTVRASFQLDESDRDVQDLLRLGSELGRRAACSFVPGDPEARVQVVFTRERSPLASYVPASSCDHAPAASSRLSLEYAHDPSGAKLREKLSSAARASLPTDLRDTPIYLVSSLPRDAAGALDLARLEAFAAAFGR